MARRPSGSLPKSLLLLVLAGALLGITSTGSVTVTSTLTAECTIAGSTFGFGNYDPLLATATEVNANALAVSCTRGAPGVTISLNQGSNSTHAADGMTRAMKTGTNYLSYDLYTSAAYTTVWNTTNTVSYASTSMASTSLTVYGLIPAAQNEALGTYTDSVTATVNF